MGMNINKLVKLIRLKWTRTQGLPMGIEASVTIDGKTYQAFAMSKTAARRKIKEQVDAELAK
jgi:hypothetical protein